MTSTDDTRPEPAADDRRAEQQDTRRTEPTARAAAPRPVRTATTGRTSAARPSTHSAATTRPRPAATTRPGGASGSRTAYGTAAAKRQGGKAAKKKAKDKRRPGLLGLLGFRKRTPLRRRLTGFLRKTFGTRTGGSGFGAPVAVGPNAGAAWWRCPTCGATETGLRDTDTATGRAARHVAKAHPGVPFRLNPQ